MIKAKCFSGSSKKLNHGSTDCDPVSDKQKPTAQPRPIQLKLSKT